MQGTEREPLLFHPTQFQVATPKGKITGRRTPSLSAIRTSRIKKQPERETFLNHNQTEVTTVSTKITGRRTPSLSATLNDGVTKLQVRKKEPFSFKQNYEFQNHKFNNWQESAFPVSYQTRWKSQRLERTQFFHTTSNSRENSLVEKQVNSFPASHNLAHSSLSRRGDLSQRLRREGWVELKGGEKLQSKGIVQYNAQCFKRMNDSKEFGQSQELDQGCPMQWIRSGRAAGLS